MKALLKKYGITAKQVELIHLVAAHPIFGALEASMRRVLPGALRHDVIKRVCVDNTPGLKRIRTITDTQIGAPHLMNHSNQWYELTDRAIEFMTVLDPSWTYTRPVPK